MVQSAAFTIGRNRIVGVVLVGTLVVAACRPNDRSNEQGGQSQAGSCATRTFSPPWLGGGLEVPGVVLPPNTTPPGGAVLYADSVDLDCDGRKDLVAQVRPPSVTSNPVLIALLRETSGEWRQVLLEQSPVAGLEGVVIAADLNGDGFLDLVTVGYDEGGQIPRMFVSVNRSYRSIGVPARYYLRHESDWGSDCLRRVLPALVPGQRLALTRETLSRSNRIGHGEDCSLPVDTVMLRGDSLN